MKHRIQFILLAVVIALCLLSGCAVLETPEAGDNLTVVLNMCTLISGN